MSTEADDWFKHLFKQGPIQTKFDLYYMCLLMGLAMGKSDRLRDAPEFVDSFVADYRSVQRLIIGLFILAEMSRLGLDLTDREEVRKLLNKYLDPASPAHLREEGFTKLNEYAHAGYLAIAMALHDQKPYHLETFLQWYGRELTQKLEANPEFAAYIKPA